MKKWSDEEINWFIINYPNNGVDYCLQHLNVTFNQLIGLRNKLKIKLSPHMYSKSRIIEKEDHEYRVNPSPFIHITDNKIAYLLGLIWADGTLCHRDMIGDRKNSISLTLLKQDFDNIKHIIDNTGKWSYYEYIPKHNPSKCFSSAKTNNRKLIEFLMRMDFHKKSGTGADKILDVIPTSIKRYFFCGLIDGDGCFYFNEKHKIRNFSITSTLEQDWGYFTKKLNELSIQYKIVRTHTEKGNYSRIVVSSFDNLKKLNDYLYPSGFELGLKRKYDKLQLCLTSYTKRR